MRKGDAVQEVPVLFCPGTELLQWWDPEGESPGGCTPATLRVSPGDCSEEGAEASGSATADDAGEAEAELGTADRTAEEGKRPARSPPRRRSASRADPWPWGPLMR